MVAQSGTNTSSSKVAILLVRARIPTVKEIPPAVQTKPPDSRRNGIVAPPGSLRGRAPSFINSRWDSNEFSGEAFCVDEEWLSLTRKE